MKVQALQEARYNPGVYLDVETVDDAVSIILTPEDGMTSKHRWQHEAPYLMSLMRPFIKDQSLVLDFGCGIGRLAKPLIEAWQCRVVGVDISPNMRALAASCIGDRAFFALGPDMLDYVKHHVFDAAIAVWALQHVLDLQAEIRLIRMMLRGGAPLFVVNNHFRQLPVDGGRWADDGLDVKKILVDEGFKEIQRGELSGADISKGWLQQHTFWAAYRSTL